MWTSIITGGIWHCHQYFSYILHAGQLKPFIPRLLGSAIVVGNDVAQRHGSLASLKATEKAFQRQGMEVCSLNNPTWGEFVDHLLCLVHNTIPDHNLTPIPQIVIAFSGVGDDEMIMLRDHPVHIADIFVALRCVPDEIPIVLLFDCIDLNGVRKTHEDPFLYNKREHIYYFSKRSSTSSPSIFDILGANLYSEDSLKSILEACDGSSEEKTTLFKSTGLFDLVSLRDLQSSLPGK